MASTSATGTSAAGTSAAGIAAVGNAGAAGTSAAGIGAVGNAGAAIRKNSRRPKPSKFMQQELPAYKPVLTLRVVVSVFFLVGIIFVPIGAVLLQAAQNVVEIADRYDDACVPANMVHNKVGYIQDENIPKDCIRILTVTRDMKQPIYIYYQLENFYQNHRRYVQSRSDEQLRDPKKANKTKSCDPEDMARGKTIIPCGLIAWSLFNDTYSFTRGGNESLSIDKNNISWKSDREHKFGKHVYPSNFQNGALIGGKNLNSSIPLSEQEDLLVWMRTAAFPTFRKLYGRLNVDLNVNDEITVAVKNNYNTYFFGGKKTLVLSTASWIGGNSTFLGYAYVFVGGLCIVLGFLFTLVSAIIPRKLGDLN